MNKIKLTVCCVGIVVFSTSGMAAPRLINYQGRLTDASTGDPIISTATVTFTFWDAESGGSQIGTFSDSDAVTPDSDGLYGTLIGDDPGNLVPETIFAADQVWLNVNINGENLTPRKRITSIGYAFNADTLDGRDSSDFASIEISSAPPSSPVQGDLYVNSTVNHIFFYDGTGWRQLDEDPASLTIFLPGGVPMEFVRIPAGTFLMGATDPWGPYPNEQPVHQVTIPYAFYMSKYELTEEQWEAVMTTWPHTDPALGDNYPARYISWNDITGATGFLNTLNAHIASTGQGPATFRLPSEAEWEYACRAGHTTRFYFGDSNCASSGCVSCQLDPYAWWCGNTSAPHEVGGKLPNPWGLYNTCGNVFEWCQDYWHADYNGAPTDGSAWESPTSSYRVIRGGGWYSPAWHCRSTSRGNWAPDSPLSSIGLRVVRDP